MTREYNNRARRGRSAESSRAPVSHAVSDTGSARPPRSGKFLDLLLFAVLLLAVVLIGRLITQKNREAIASSGEKAAAAHVPVITEIMPSNRSALIAEDGESYDWFEVTNMGKDELALKGFAVADSLEKTNRYVFGDAVLAPGQSVVVYCAGAEYSGQEDCAPFRLKSSGETLYLLDTYGEVISSVTCPILEPDTAYALNPSTQEWIVTAQYTPGFPNTQDGWDEYSASRRADSSDILIWEVMTSNKITNPTQGGEYYDWVELFNRGAEAVNLEGYCLSDSESNLRRYVFGNVTIQPGEYLLVYCAKEGYGVEGELIASFGLNSLSEQVVFSSPSGMILDSVLVERLDPDTSWGRTSDGASAIFTKPTPGYANTDDGYQQFRSQPSSLGLGDVAISEIKTVGDESFKDAAGHESPWVEIVNRSGNPVNLKGYGLADDAKHIGLWEFPDVTLAVGARLVVFCDGTDTSDEQGELHSNFKLQVSGGETLVLSDPGRAILDACVVDRIPEGMSYGRPEGERQFAYLKTPSPREANGGESYIDKCSMPVFSLAMGNYVNAQQVEIYVPEGTTVRYTTDGSKPKDSSSAYTGPITVSENTVLRAAAFRDGYVKSETATTTYFINEAFDLPLVSLSVDPYEMFDERNGLYMRGPDQTYPYNDANFMSNKELEANIELLETDGTIGLSQGFGLRMFGAFSRYEDKKNFSCMSRPQWGEENFDYQLFPELSNDSYDNFILRAGASEWHMSMIRDVVISKLAAQYTDLDVQASRPCVVFINGKYWGVYFIMEKINASFFEEHYHIPKESVNLLVGNGRSNSEVKSGSNKSYLELLNFCKENDLSKAENYEWVKAHMDVENYAAYVAAEMYTTNTDTGNIKFWMSEAYDGRWRWILYDTDWALLKQNAKLDYTEEYIDPRGHGVGNGFDTDIIIALLKNSEFKQIFLKTCAYLCNTVYSEDSLVSMVDQVAGEIDSSMERDRERWSPCDREGGTMVTLSYKGWQANVESIRTFARTRRSFFVEDVQKDLHVSDADMKEIFGESP